MVNPFTGVAADSPVDCLATSSGFTSKGCHFEEVDPLVMDVVCLAWSVIGDREERGRKVDFPHCDVGVVGGVSAFLQAKLFPLGGGAIASWVDSAAVCNSHDVINMYVGFL